MEQKLLTIPEHQRYYSGTPTLLFRNTNVPPRVVLCPPLFLIFYWPLYVLFVFVFWLLIIPLVPSNDFRIEKMLGSSLPPFVCGRTHVLFTLFVFSCVFWYPAHIVLCFFVLFVLCLVYSMLPVSLDFPFLVAPSVFYNVFSIYLEKFGTIV